MNQVIVLIATTPRLSLLSRYALPSIINQTFLPTAVVIVSDTRQLSCDEQLRLQFELKDIPVKTLTNARCAGAAGSWNTGIDYIADRYPNSYIAIIDDDDYWSPQHLASCVANSDNGKANVVLSGINIKIGKNLVACNIPSSISKNDFLVGNPGWQGSNTFVKTELAKYIGGFTDGLISCNDRDFAIKVLDSGKAAISYTKLASVDWNCNQSPDALSAPKSQQKLKGCAQFLRLHGDKMSEPEMDSYYQRIQDFFSIPRKDVLEELKNGNN
ncbi:glycosyltransferase family 2 protein [Vibrio sp. RC27]